MDLPVVVYFAAERNAAAKYTNHRRNKTMTTRERQIYISKVKRFARSKAGLAKIRRIAPELAQIIELHPDYLDIVQKKNDPRVAGCYLNSIFEQAFYSGSSGNAILRECEHIYNFLTDAAAYGGVYKTGMQAHFKIYATGVTNSKMRESIEFLVIDKLHPLLQYTDPNSSEYGTDKPIAAGKTRETIRADICIFPPMRAKRFAEAEAEAAERGTV